MPNQTISRNETHRWRFFRYGGFDQVSLDTAEDLQSLAHLDQKLWAALGCPTHGLDIETRTLAWIDTDGDGRIRATDIIAAVEWMCKLLKNPKDLTRRDATLPLDSINASTEEGTKLLASAKQILRNLGMPDAKAISAEETADSARIFANTAFNGDGVITDLSTSDSALLRVMGMIREIVGETIDRSGRPGINGALVEQFFQRVKSYQAWLSEAESDADAIKPLGDATANAFSVFAAVEIKIDDYFTRCALAAFSKNAGEVATPSRELLQRLQDQNISSRTPELTNLPIAAISRDGKLSLTTDLNPAWQKWVQQFRDVVVTPLIGATDNLTLEHWQLIRVRLSPYQQWMEKMPVGNVNKLAPETAREILAADYSEQLHELIKRDQSFEAEALSITSVDKLTLYYRDLFRVVNNFVSFRDFYQKAVPANFQAGVLYLDGRSFELCIFVEDVARHSALAGASRIYLVYCECVRKSSGEKRYVAVGITEGSPDNIMVGRNGIFYDRKGLPWDATVVKTVENPISIRQAFWSPYKRISRLISEQIERFATTRDKQVEAKSAVQVSSVSDNATPSKNNQMPFDIAKFAGIFAAIGLALGALGTAVASVVTGFLLLAWWQMPLALVGIVLAISGPAMIGAWLKLRRRNLAPLLDAAGWAINGQAKLNLPFGSSLTKLAELPEGSQRLMRDPFEQKSSAKKWIIIGALFFVLCSLWYFGAFSLVENTIP